MNQRLNHKKYFSDTGILTECFESKGIVEAVSGIEDFIDGFEEVYEKYGFKMVSKGYYVGKNVEIDKTARIEGKAIIGHNVTIGHAAYVRGGVVLLDNVHVGHATEIKHSIILSKTALAHLNYIGDSIVGAKVNISAGAVLANWRFDKKDVEIKFEDETIPTGLEKFGSVLGDNCFIGVNSVLNPGTVLQKKSLVYPLVSVRGGHLKTKIFK